MKKTDVREKIQKIIEQAVIDRFTTIDDAIAILSIVREAVKEKSKKPYCGFDHDKIGIERDMCDECNAVDKAFKELMKGLS